MKIQMSFSSLAWLTIVIFFTLSGYNVGDRVGYGKGVVNTLDTVNNVLAATIRADSTYTLLSVEDVKNKKCANYLLTRKTIKRK